MMTEVSEDIVRIKVLPPEEARKIAAGEVIDRPAALIREFLDNAIDAEAKEIEVNIEEGGSKKAEVNDNGGGMSRGDLLVCLLPHATSKIRCLDDLAFSGALGFRGEALAAAAATARLEILSSRDGREAWLLEAEPGEEPRLSQSRRTRGTTVRALGLFDAVPARKRFLKRENSEGNLCRQAFLDRVLAFPELSFRFNQDGRMRDFFPPAPERERFAALALKNGEAVFLHEVRAAGQGFGIYAVIGGPELYRNDRRQQYVFTNRRRIYDYSILQALEYGLQGWFPNGTHPVGAVYITIEPGLADFNIHPAKREVRFDDPGAIHRILSGALRSFVQSHEKARGSGTALYAGVSSGEGGPGNLFAAEDPGTGYAGGKTEGSALAMEALMENAPSFRPLPGRNGEKPRYAGRVFGLFILVEKGDRLFVIDQHAAHERILYNRFLSGPIAAQELLVPIPFETESAGDDSFLDAEKTRLALLGIILERDGAAWRLKALPQGWKLGDRETIREILALREAGDNIAERWAASLACHGAVRDGDYLDEESALALAEEALKLPEPRCPHGRPLWMELSRENLFKAVRRT